MSNPLNAIFVACLLCLSLTAQNSGQETTKESAQDNEKAPPQASINDVDWIAGSWHGEAMGGKFEESWSPPSAGTMMGMFKFIKADKVSFYELLTIVPKDGSLLLRLKHFSDSLVGWEEKDKSIEFPLVSLSENEAKFDGLTFQKISDDEMHITVVIQQSGDKKSEVKFVCKRTKN